MLSKEDKKLHLLIGERLTNLRKKAGYSSQEIFAYDAEVPRALYGRYEKGSNLTISSLYKILKFHKLTLKEFFSKGFDELKIEVTKKDSKEKKGAKKEKVVKKTKR
ncbi:MAG TPA: helix-turn-helix transcriptional regulator [Bacteroidia bacterium]|nr:helix-turn-helix transcriptional regulator [Bacteroidia bacterium]